MKSLRDIAQGFKNFPHRWWYIGLVVWFFGIMVLTDPLEFERCDSGPCIDAWP